jgi:hypothetical protein
VLSLWLGERVYIEVYVLKQKVINGLRRLGVAGGCVGAKRKYRFTKNDVLQRWGYGFECVRVWLSKLNGAKATRVLNLFYFCDWAGKDPSALLELKSSFDSLDAERLLDRFVVESPLPECTRWNSVLAVKSFFRCNYKQLQPEAGKIDYVQVRPQRSPSKQSRFELYRACFNQRDRTLICVSCCSAIALETLINLRWYHFEQDWTRQAIPHISIPSELIKGHGKGKYRGVRQETFVTPEAKQELIRYRDFMTKNYGVIWRQDSHVFLSLRKPAKPLTYPGLSTLIRTISERASVGFSIHDGRRIVETALENISTPRNWIQKIKGRKVRGEDAPYSKPAIEQLREKYREALPELEFLSVSAEVVEGFTVEELELIRDLLRERKQRQRG